MIESNQEKKLKLAFVAPGSLLHTVKWLNGLVDKNLQITLITQHSVTATLDKRVAVEYLPFSGAKGYLLNALALHAKIKALAPDVINVHYASGYGTLALLAKIKPYILSVWGSDVYEFPFQSRFKHWLIKRSLSNAQHIASTSYAMAEQVKTILSADDLTITITPFGVDLQRFTNTAIPFKKPSITIGVVKRLEHKYGIDILINAFAQLLDVVKHKQNLQTHEVNLMIVGDGSLELELKSLAKQLGVQNQVNFVGAVDNSVVPKYINQMDIFVVPSRIESFGVAAIEALACERPCIVANTGGLPEVIKADETGIVVEQNSEKQFVEAIIGLLENKDRAIAMGINGRTDVLAKYSQQAALNTMTTLYKTVYAQINK